MNRWIRIACAALLLGGCAANSKRFQEMEGRVANQEAVAGQQARAMGVLEARMEQERAKNEELERLHNESKGRLEAHESALSGYRTEIDGYRGSVESYRSSVDEYKSSVDGVRDQHTRLLRARLESVRRSIQSLEDEASQLEGMISELETRSPTYPRDEMPLEPEEDDSGRWEPRDEPQPRP